MLPYQLGQLALVLAFGIVIVLLLLLDLDEQGRLISRLTARPLPELCVLKRETGVDCPTCGLTRALVLIGRFEVESARSLHPSAPSLALLLLLQIMFRPFLALVRLTGRRAWSASTVDFLVNFGLVLWVLPRPLG